MPFTEEQAKQIKAQLFQQITNLPESQQAALKKQIESMNPEQLEKFLIQNNMIQQEQDGESVSSPKTEQGGCVFCNIAEGKVSSYKLAENKSAIAILDINPVGKGHSLVIPKKHSAIEKLPTSVLSLAKKIAKKIKSKLKPEDIKIETSSIQGHGIINIIPFYKDQKPEKKQAKPEELQELQKKLASKPRAKRKKPEKSKPLRELPKFPLRIP